MRVGYNVADVCLVLTILLNVNHRRKYMKYQSVLDIGMVCI